MLNIHNFFKREDGSSAVELALIIPLFMLPLLSVVDLGFYMHKKIQVEFAAQAGVAALHRACAFTNIPITDNSKCTSTVLGAGNTLKSVVTSAVQSTSLGSAVTVGNTCSSGSGCWSIESYLCMNSAGKLVSAKATGLTPGQVNTSTGAATKPTAPPADCSQNGGVASQKPGDYLNVVAKYTYTPMFGALSVASLLPRTMTKEAFLRVG